MHHCTNGPGPNVFGGATKASATTRAQHDIVMALDRWVEDGVAPEKIIASHLTNGTVDRTLALCPTASADLQWLGDANMAEIHSRDGASLGARWCKIPGSCRQLGAGCKMASSAKVK